LGRSKELDAPIDMGHSKLIKGIGYNIGRWCNLVAFSFCNPNISSLNGIL